MHALLHTAGAVVVVPYVALALLFLFIGQVARSKGWMALIDVVWNNVDWYLGWGIYAAPLLWVGLVATGFVSRLRRAGSLCLGLLAVACLLVIVTLSSKPVGVGELIFLFPCVVVVATSAWLCFHRGARLEVHTEGDALRNIASK